MNVSGRDSKFKGRWDGASFSFERDVSYGFSWPQRNYNCTFCKKEFKSAQALGGHMNVHRRDRAKQLSQHSSSSSSSDINTTPNPNPNLFFSPSPPTPSFFDKVVSDAVSPQIREIRKKLAVEATNRNESRGLMKQLKADEASRVHNKKINQLFGLDLNMPTTGRDGSDEDLDLELRLGSF